MFGAVRWASAPCRPALTGGVAVGVVASSDMAMDITKILQELRTEHAAISHAIAVFESLASGHKRMGRPPKWMPGTGDRRGTFIRSPEARARMAAAQRACWAKRRRAKS